MIVVVIVVVPRNLIKWDNFENRSDFDETLQSYHRKNMFLAKILTRSLETLKNSRFDATNHI